MTEMFYITVVPPPPHSQFHFLRNGKFQEKQFISFKLHEVLSSMMKAHAVSLNPIQFVSCLFVSFLMLYTLPALPTH